MIVPIDGEFYRRFRFLLTIDFPDRSPYVAFEFAVPSLSMELHHPNVSAMPAARTIRLLPQTVRGFGHVVEFWATAEDMHGGPIGPVVNPADVLTQYAIRSRRIDVLANVTRETADAIRVRLDELEARGELR